MDVLYTIRSASEPDLALIHEWRSRPHVSCWWGDPLLEPEGETLAEPDVAMWIVEADARPFAFLQDYDVHAGAPHHFDYLPPGSRGLDGYIGEPDMLFGGHGPRFLRQHCDDLFARGVPAVGIDPHPDNAPARRAFEKAGFIETGGPLETQWGRVMLMQRSAPLPSAACLSIAPRANREA